jgi:hypothetical protein
MENCVWSNVSFCKVRQNAENQHLFLFGRAHLKLVIGSVGQPMIYSKKFVTFAIYFLHKFLSLIYSTYTDGYKQNHICSLPEITYFRFYLAIMYIFQILYTIFRVVIFSRNFSSLQLTVSSFIVVLFSS